MRHLLLKCFFIFFGIVLVSPVAAQQFSSIEEHRLDSLQSIADKLSDTARVDLLNAIAFDRFGYNHAKAREILSEALELAEKIGYDKGKSETLVYIGLYERIVGNAQPALRYLKEGTALAKKSGNQGATGYGLTQLAILMNRLGKADSALVFFNQAYTVLKDSLAPMQLSVLYRNLGNYYGDQRDKEKQRFFLFRAMRIREALKIKFMLSDIYVQLASYYSSEAKFDEALVYIAKAEEINKQDVESESLFDLKYQKATILMKQANYIEALSIFNDLKVRYRQRSSKGDIVKLLTDIGYSLMDLGNFETSLLNFYEALQVASENGFELEEARLLWQIGYVYQEMKQYGLAKEFARKCLNVSIKNGYRVEEATANNLLGVIDDAIGKYDSASYYLNKALTVRETLHNPLRTASTLNNIGIMLIHQKKYQEALKYQLRSYNILKENNDPLGMSWGMASLGDLYMHLGDMAKAKMYLDEGEKLSLKLRAKQITLPLYLSKIKWFEMNGNPHQALVYFKKYDQLKDSVYSTSLLNRVSSLQNEYTILQKNQQIELLKKDKEISDREVEIQQDKVQQQQLIIFFGTTVFLMLLGGAYVIYINYKKVRALNMKIQESSEEVQAQSEELQLSNQTIVQINEKLETMVEERTRELKQAYKELDTFFYRSSHDFRRPLTTFMGLAEVANITVKDQTALELFEKVNETARNLDKMLMKLQSVSDMGSQQLAYKEIFLRDIFENELEVHRDLIRDHSIKVTNDIDPNFTFYSYPALIKIICENLIENAIYFRKDYDDGIKLSTISDDDGTTIIVEDKGQGISREYIERVFDMYFRANERSKGNGLGLYIVKKVTEKLHGTVTLTSTVGVGTIVTIFIPNQVNG